MKRKFLIAFIAVFLAGSATMFAQETGVVINGVKWATRNVDAPGAFAEKPESSGMFYQWNRKTAWAATGSITGWDTTNPTGAIWEKSNDPSPVGWRVPTFEEIEKLLDKEIVNIEYANVNGVAGNRFTDKLTGNSIFIPIVGTRNYSDGTLEQLYNSGGYWSSTQKDNNGASVLLFVLNQALKGSGNRSSGLLVRCVAE